MLYSSYTLELYHIKEGNMETVLIKTVLTESGITSPVDSLCQEEFPGMMEGPVYATFKEFAAVVNPTITAINKLVSCGRYSIHGTVHMMMIENQKYLLKIYSGNQLPIYLGVELAALQFCIGETGRMYRRAGLLLTRDGKWKMHDYNKPEDQATFFAGLTVYRWKEINHNG